MTMLGFLKRLLGWGAKGGKTRVAVPVDPVVPFTPLPEPVFEPEPVIPAPFTPEPPAFDGPTLAFPAEEPSGYEMIHSVGNPDAYMVGLVGEQDHALAVRDLQPGTPVTLELEPGNPHDPSAIAAVDGHGRVIGYIAQESWLREAVYGAGAGFTARVLAVETGSRGFREVVLEVEPGEHELRERRYQPPR
jgi:hypothetical protein